MGQITLERIPHEKQVAVRTLQLAGYSDVKISKSVGVSRNTVHAIKLMLPANSTEVEHCKNAMLRECYGNAMRAQVRVTDQKLDEMNALQLTTIAGINIDKARDMEGLNRPQFNIVNVVQEVKTTRDKLEKQMSAIAARRAQISAASTVGDAA